MKRGIFILLIIIAIIGSAALYYIKQGPSVFLKPPASERIAFVSDRSGNYDIWTMNTDGSDLMQLTNDEANDRMPIWSPDAKEILLLSDKVGDTYQIFETAWNGEYSHRITTSTGTKDMPVWSKDGKQIAFISGAKVYVMDSRSNQEKQFLPAHDSPDLSAMSGQSHSFIYAAWSENGKSMLYIQDIDFGKQASILELEGNSTESHDLKPIPLMVARNMDAEWSPVDSSRGVLTYIDSPENGSSGLLVFDSQTFDAKTLIRSKSNTEGYARPKWSPNGQAIVFEVWTISDGIPDKCKGIYTIDASGGEKKLIASGDAQQPFWSSDGTQLIYSLRGENGKRDIWKVNADGSNPVNLTKGQGDNKDAVWSPAISGK